jgi:hypothetical protein
MPWTLTDEHAHLAQLRAQVLNRDAIVGKSEATTSVQRMPDPQRHIDHMQPWARQFLAAQDLLFALDWEGQSSSAGRAHCVMRLRQGAALFQMERPSLDLFKDELTDVMSMADLRIERAEEILAQIDHQWAFWSALLPLRADLKPRTLEVLQSVIWLCVSVEMRFKQVLGVRRPQEFSPQVQPVITTPGHGSFPMGHATQAYAVAETLRRLLGLTLTDSLAVQLERQAHRIAINRIVAGVHFPVDLVAGMMLGKSLAALAQACAQPSMAGVQTWSFTERNHRAHGQAWASAEALALSVQGHQTGAARVLTKPEQMPVWRRVWAHAEAEWGQDR